ncbi:SDR family NAD(P)-dependent oxidoreductase [Sphingosinicella soli]|uniref:NAD(P)-dependent dehydrogenase (Short-subunit alcohol dehydrogenase family) n=1 Tax=Sphingosinicella soli TaxID=333708 RepID=A0A7W7B0X2_9SPHN|nr:SDR family NAD(P)-dependent oxidoreductase [Sphingosinicella soli]MBB4632006.1 NAD(P)-dependent dehydrogenase (short-subunit alcohol dehydrogenase family) [Sphingosinicella soli]
MNAKTQRDPLVVVVTGASRGLGRGIARAFGSKCATVFLTGRSIEGGLQEAAAEVTANGGKGIAVACDHGDDASVAKLFDTVRTTSSRIDILVNNAAAVYADDLTAPGGFWEKPLRLVDMIDVGLRSNYVASYHAVPLMLAAGKGLIASISFYGAVSYFHGPAYGAAKAGTDKMMADMAIDLGPHGVHAVSLWPGFIRTEMIAAIAEEDIPPDMVGFWPLFETPEFTGMVIDALYSDPKLSDYSGQTLIGAELGQRYGIVDLDGKTPIAFRDTMGSPAPAFVPAASAA